MNKKGTSIILMIFEIVAVIMVIGIAFSAVSKFSTSENVLKVRYAEEVKMMVNTMLGTPGNAQVVFPYDVTNYVFRIAGSQVIVFIEGKDSSEQLATRSFFEPKGYTVTGSSLGPENEFCMIKSGKKIELGACP